MALPYRRATMKEKILSLINEGKYLTARSEISKLNVVDAAHLFEEIEPQQILIIFRILPKDFSSETFSHMSTDLKKYVIDSLTDEEAIRIFDDLFFDDAVDLLEEMPANVVKRILRNTNAQTRELINQFLKYPDDSAGSLMTIEYVDLKSEMTVAQAIQYIKDIGIDKRTINTCYVMDSSRVLNGVVSLRRLILSDESELVKDIMETDFISVTTLDDQEDVAARFKKYDYYVMPVVDKENRLVGIITVDDILDVIDQEATEDIQKMAAMQPSETEYLKSSNWALTKHRLPWLLILMLNATFTAGIIQKYESALQSAIILTAFIPMLMDTGGNSGSQSSSLIIRGLALGQIKTKDILKIIAKEFSVGVIAGSILAAVNFLRLYFINQEELSLALTVTLTLFITVVIAKIVGGVLPMFAQKLKLDPAVMASPIITSIVDVVSLFIYFYIATFFLKL